VSRSTVALDEPDMEWDVGGTRTEDVEWNPISWSVSESALNGCHS
jgi:hypothetical protein